METPATRRVVLVVEDERAIGELIASAISDEPGYCAIHVLEPTAALETTKHITPDVMVVDLSLPRVRGLEVVRALASLIPEVQVLVFSNELRLRSGALGAGAAAFVRKDAPEEALVREIRRVATA